MRIWLPLFVPPLTFLALVAVAYALVPWSCEAERRLPTHFVSIVALGVAAWCLTAAWRDWKASGVEPPTDEPEPTVYLRFVNVLGLMLSALMCVAIAALWLTQFALPPCVR